VIDVRTLQGNPFNAHTLAAQIAQTERITAEPTERAYVDRGYCSHDADKRRILPSEQTHDVMPSIRGKDRQRAGIESVAGHRREDDHLGCNILTGVSCDARRPCPI
jgi:IS5 family transposase